MKWGVTMKITFLGAAKTVTGSCFLVQTNKKKFLVDCGMFQGYSKESLLNEEPFPFDVSEISFILLTHAHIDHSGRIPKIYKDGYRGPVYASKATCDLCGVMLPDSGHIQEMENEWINRKRGRAGKPPVEPLYTYQNAIDSLQLFRPLKYDELVPLDDDIKVRLKDAGHMLGSSFIELWINENGEETKIVFTGDIGNKDIPILRDPSVIDSADYIVMESTYGNKIHKDNENRVSRFVDIINETIDKGGNVIIPSFAVGRTQEIIYELNKQKDEYGDKLSKIFNIPVFIDSPLAISATEIFRQNLDCYDEEAREYIENGDNPLDFPGLEFTRTPEESRALNERTGSCIIISASGMCEAGRIKHHLKHNLWRKDSTILFVGYQAEGTLGRRLVEGAKKVKLFGEEISVNARIEMIEGFSGHADMVGLLEWIEKIREKPSRIFIVHGEEEVMKDFANTIRGKFGIETVIPSKGETYDVLKGTVITRTEITYQPSRFERLAVLDMLDTLKEEIDELSDIIRSDLKEGKDDKYVDRVKNRLKILELMILDVLKESEAVRG